MNSQAQQSDDIAISMVIPMYNEQDIAREAVSRVLRVGEQLGRSYEVLAIDDGSSDATPAVLAELRATEPNFRWIQLRPNCGQPDSSKAGMLSARGRAVVVLDADLQTPPEVVPELLAALEAAPPEVVAVFGVTSTTQRDDPLRLLVGQAVFYFLEDRFGRHPMPHGASSFFVMRAEVARRIARLPFRSGNIGAVVAALGLVADSRFYVKPRSYREDSRLGLSGHVREAVGSLALTGVLPRFGWAGAAVGVPVGAVLLATGASATAAVALGAAAGCAAVAVGSQLFARRALDSTRPSAIPMFEGEPSRPASEPAESLR